MTWTSFHRRGDVLREVVAAADRRRDGRLPTDLPGVRAVFDDDADLLGALQLRWHTRLAGRIEREQLAEPMALRDAVVRAWRATAHDLPGIRAVLDAQREAADLGPVDDRVATVLRKSAAKEHVLLASMAGLSGAQDPRGAAVGAAIEAEARAGLGAVRVADSGSRSLLGRLRAVLAAA